MKRWQVLLSLLGLTVGAALHLSGSGLPHENTVCQEQVLYQGANYKVYDYYTPAGFSPVYLGSGSFGVVITGVLPEGFEKAVEVPPGAGWRAGLPVAIKTPKRDEFVSRNEKSIEHERTLLRILMAADPEGNHFWREGYDEKRNVIVESFDPDVISLDKWLKPEFAKDHTVQTKEKIVRQLEVAVSLIHDKHWVHSDLKLANILINFKTHQVWLYDYSLSAPVGGYPTYLGEFRDGNPQYSSPNQRAHKPAEAADDHYSLVKIYRDLDRAISKLKS